ncbi:hypothetical protein MRX96_050126 [Rhipicephalus microplus]
MEQKHWILAMVRFAGRIFDGEEMSTRAQGNKGYVLVFDLLPRDTGTVTAITDNICSISRRSGTRSTTLCK